MKTCAIVLVFLALHLQAQGQTAGPTGPVLPFDPNRFDVSNEPREDFWVTDGPVHAILVTNGVVYLGGEFNSVLPNTRRFGGLFDVSTGTADPDFPRANGPVHTAVSDGQGGWYVGGEFTELGGVSRMNLAHIRSDLTVDPTWHVDRRPSVLFGP